MLVEARSHASSRAGVGLARSRRCTSDGMRPIGKIPPDRQQASSRNWPLVTSPVIAGDALPAFIGTPPGSTAPVREHCTTGNGGGFAALEADWRRVAGVSRF